MWQCQWAVWGYSGLTYEKPWNSSWSRLAISSWSGGVSSGGWRVKKRSKFSASRPHCHGEERVRQRWGEGHGGCSEFWWRMWRKTDVDRQHQREKRERQLKHGINQSNRSQSELWISIGPRVSQWYLSFIIGDYADKSQFAFVRVVPNGRRWLGSGDERANCRTTYLQSSSNYLCFLP